MPTDDAEHGKGDTHHRFDEKTPSSCGGVGPWTDEWEEVGCKACIETYDGKTCNWCENELDPEAKECPGCDWEAGVPVVKETIAAWMQDLSKCPDCERAYGKPGEGSCRNPDCESNVIEYKGILIWQNPNWD